VPYNMGTDEKNGYGRKVVGGEIGAPHGGRTREMREASRNQWVAVMVPVI